MSGRQGRLLLSRFFLSKNQPSSQKRFQKLAVAEKGKKKTKRNKNKEKFRTAFRFCFSSKFLNKLAQRCLT